MKSWVLTLGGLLTYVSIGATAMLFQGGNMPHFVNIDNSETAVAYTNGVVYTNDGRGLLDSRRTLWREKDGTIMSSQSVIGQRFFIIVPLPATPEEVVKWEKAQARIRTDV